MCSHVICVRVLCGWTLARRKVEKNLSKIVKWNWRPHKNLTATHGDRWRVNIDACPRHWLEEVWWICAGRVVDAMRPPSDPTVVFNKKCQVGAASPTDAFSLAISQTQCIRPAPPLPYPSHKVDLVLYAMYIPFILTLQACFIRYHFK